MISPTFYKKVECRKSANQKSYQKTPYLRYKN